MTEAVRLSAPVATNKDAAATASSNPETIKARKKRSMPVNVCGADPVPPLRSRFARGTNSKVTGGNRGRRRWLSTLRFARDEGSLLERFLLETRLPKRKRPPLLPETFSFALHLASFRRLQARRVKPFCHMRGGVSPSCPQQQILALAARRKCPGFLAISFGLNAKPLFQRDRLFESSSLHDVLPFIRSGLERYRRFHYR
jgi:hypothetical protein